MKLRFVFGLSLTALLIRMTAGTPDAFQTEVEPRLKEYCVSCHGEKKSKAGVNFASYTNAASMFRNPQMWEATIRQLEDRQMPPTDKPQPTVEQRIVLIEFLKHLLDNPDPSWIPADPGNSVVHRLNRTEYNNTLRDLLGVTNHLADAFPADGGGGGGFDNNADTLFVPPILMERYLTAAELAIAQANPSKLHLAPAAWYRSDRGQALKDLEAFATRAYRHPVDTEEMESIARLYDGARGRGTSAELAFKGAIKAILVSPSFLFRIEHLESGNKPWKLNDYELASRMSYFIWSSMPDEELFHLAEKRQLSEPATLAAQVKRMLEDSKSRALAENFTGQWLGTRKLATVASPDRGRFPQYNDSVRSAMMAEPVEFFASLLRDNASLLRLIDADYTYVNTDLAAFYGLPKVEAPGFVRVSLPDRKRGGIVTMAAVLTQTSYPLRTSPVLRGKWILEEILGTPPPPPPPLVATLPADDHVKEGLTFRQRLEKHRKDPNCSGCHSRMDPLGFALENFDPVGQWREKISDQPVDASGRLINGDEVNGPIALKDALLNRKALFVRQVTGKMMAYALGRGLEHYDLPEVKKITSQLSTNDFRAVTLVTSIVQSYPFQYRRGDKPIELVGSTQ